MIKKIGRDMYMGMVNNKMTGFVGVLSVSPMYFAIFLSHFRTISGTKYTSVMTRAPPKPTF